MYTKLYLKELRLSVGRKEEIKGQIKLQGIVEQRIPNLFFLHSVSWWVLINNVSILCAYIDPQVYIYFCMTFDKKKNLYFKKEVMTLKIYRDGSTISLSNRVRKAHSYFVQTYDLNIWPCISPYRHMNYCMLF